MDGNTVLLIALLAAMIICCGSMVWMKLRKRRDKDLDRE